MMSQYTFFDADFVFYIPWPKSYFVKIISKRINYFEWYSLLFCVQSFTQMYISSSMYQILKCKSDDSGKVRPILSKLHLQFFPYYYTLLLHIIRTTTCVIIDRRWSWNMIKFNFTGSACQTNPCGKNALCQDSPDGAYRCTCQEGYTGDPFRGCIGMLND